MRVRADFACRRMYSGPRRAARGWLHPDRSSLHDGSRGFRLRSYSPNPFRGVSMKVQAAGLIAAVVAVLAFQSSKPPKDQLPQFTSDDKLIRPTGCKEWGMVGASTGLSTHRPSPIPDSRSAE